MKMEDQCNHNGDDALNVTAQISSEHILGSAANRIRHTSQCLTYDSRVYLVY